MRKKPVQQFHAQPSKSYPATPFTCVTCEMEIAGPPTFHVGLSFCCGGCAVSGPCSCSYDERDAALAAQHEAAVPAMAAFAVAAPTTPARHEPVLAELPTEREPVLAGR